MKKLSYSAPGVHIKWNIWNDWLKLYASDVHPQVHSRLQSRWCSFRWFLCVSLVHHSTWSYIFQCGIFTIWNYVDVSFAVHIPETLLVSLPIFCRCKLHKCSPITQRYRKWWWWWCWQRWWWWWWQSCWAADQSMRKSEPITFNTF